MILIYPIWGCNAEMRWLHVAVRNAIDTPDGNSAEFGCEPLGPHELPVDARVETHTLREKEMPTSRESQKTLAENEKWLKDNQKRTFHRGDLPISDAAPKADRVSHDQPDQQ